MGIVPNWSNVVVTGHFSVYEPDPNRILPEYFHRIIQTRFFREHLWRNKVGAEGRKEVKLDFFEAQAVPVPPLSTQEVIIAHWRNAQANATTSREVIFKLEADIQTGLYKALRMKLPTVDKPLPKVFGLWWKDIGRWSLNFNQQTITRLDPRSGRYPTATMGSLILDLENGRSPKCHNRPASRDEWGVLKLGAVSFGTFNPNENKALPSALKPDPHSDNGISLPRCIQYLERAFLGY